MKIFSYALLLGLFYIPVSFADTSAKGVDNKMENKQSGNQGALRKCTHLLPEGHKYTISIIGTSDKTTKEVNKQFKGEFKLSNGSKKPLDKKRNEEIKPFIQCVTETVL
ncbi:hypothetical protein; putative exported protein [Xenorhabdus bovienii str. oregonense]|uniref:Uncharacterized protein n=1 Tax=Xenorhabdus bovienii str. oregonense TaxID=1398202 RepID=A0A077P4L4_XENBV|nr:hypothetical protein [Xenorhabdus bovienii]CDH06015.1 hypothetical protein; putative exported protein [Xenorhabdus bovienii str. oregonense]